MINTITRLIHEKELRAPCPEGKQFTKKKKEINNSNNHVEVACLIISQQSSMSLSRACLATFILSAKIVYFFLQTGQIGENVLGTRRVRE